ncbi:MAG: GNAT family N-acetyltransferase [Leptospira sp.]|nr:GNAT family N-acetyltransferase [Leptospira sp.]NCS95110.1 GNAT family N-acetyltransferase [Leptospira sp.]
MDGIRIQKLGPKEITNFIELILIFEDVFEMEEFNLPNELHFQNLLSKEDFIVFVATKDNKVIAGLTAYILPQYYSAKPSVYIYDIAVQTDFQRKGLGSDLLKELNNYCNDKGMKEIFVQADLEDHHAIEFYRANGGSPMSVVHFTYLLNPS